MGCHQMTKASTFPRGPWNSDEILQEPKDGMKLITLQATRKNNSNIDSKAPAAQKGEFLFK